MTINENINQLISNMADQLQKLVAERNLNNPAMIGIQTGGIWVAEQLYKKMQIQDPLGNLNISFYRDDFSRIGLHPQVQPSEIPFSTEHRDIILVDDVLFTGRTIKAAINAIFDFGRPDSIILAVLVDRGHRELPIQPDVVGKTVELKANEQIKLLGPTPLQLSVHEVL
mgnify:CR=1 FL=1